MSTLRTSNLIHGSSAVTNIVLDTIGRAIFGPDGPNGRAALYVNPQNNRVGINTESPTATLTVDGAISATGDVTVGGTINLTGALSVDTLNAGAGTEAAPSVSVGTTDNGLYSPGTDQVAISTNGTGQLFVDSSGDVGIGTSSPAGKLTLKTTNANGAPTGWDNSYFVISEGDTSTSFGLGLSLDTTNNEAHISSLTPNSLWNPLNYRASEHKFFVTDAADNEVVRINNLGAVIYYGNSSSSWTLSPASDTTAYAQIDAHFPTGNRTLFTNGNTDNDSYAVWNRNSGSSGKGFGLEGQNFKVVQGSNEQLRVDGSGKLVVGATSFISASNSYAQVMTSDSQGGLIINSTDTSSGSYGRLLFTPNGNVVGNEGLIRYNNNDFHMGFYTQGSEAMRIDSSGRLFVGADNINAPGVINAISNSTTSALRAIGQSSMPNGSSALTVDKHANINTTSQVFVAFTINVQNTGSGQINANGASQAAFGTFSDRRLKENIVDIPSQLENICKLRPVEFDYIQSEGGGHQISFIAQEVEEVYPDAIGEREDGMKTLTGWGKTEAILVKALQEAIAKIETLEQRLTDAGL